MINIRVNVITRKYDKSLTLQERFLHRSVYGTIDGPIMVPYKSHKIAAHKIFQKHHEGQGERREGQLGLV